MKNFSPKPKGFVLIITVLVVSAIISVIIISISLSSITRLENTNTALQGTRAKILTESCSEEALIRLNRDNTYSRGSLSLETGVCSIAITTVGGNKEIAVTGTLNGYTHTLTIETSLSPFQIVKWDN